MSHSLDKGCLAPVRMYVNLLIYKLLLQTYLDCMKEIFTVITLVTRTQTHSNTPLYCAPAAMWWLTAIVSVSVWDPLFISHFLSQNSCANLSVAYKVLLTEQAAWGAILHKSKGFGLLITSLTQLILFPVLKKLECMNKWETGSFWQNL